MANRYTKVGTVNLRKDGSGSFIKLSVDNRITDNLKILAAALSKVGKDGLILNVEDPRVSLDKAVKAGRMEAEKADYLKSKIPDYIKFELTLVEKDVA